MKISEIIEQAAIDYGDYDEDGGTDDARFTRVKIADWANYYNRAMRQLVLMRPDANQKTASWELGSGDAKQSVPADCVQLLSLERNMGSTGSAPGAPIQQTDRQALKQFVSTWHTGAAVTEIELYAYNLELRNYFWVYPVPGASVYVEGVYGHLFDDVALADIATTDFPADSIFINPSLDWMKREAFSINIDSAYSQELSARFEQSFYQSLGLEFRSASGIIESFSRKRQQ